MADGAADGGALSALRVRQTAGWIVALGVAGAMLFTSGLAVRVGCAVGHCPSRDTRRLLDLDAVGSLPRLFTTALFVAAAVLAVRAAVRVRPPARWWWSLVALGAAVLAGAKLVSAHSAAEEADGRWTTLIGGVLLALVGLPLLWWCGRRWAVPAAGAVTFALAVYAAAALGLDQVTGLAHHLAGRGRISVAVATFVEEGGEAVTALLLLASAVRWLPPSRSSAAAALSRTGS